MILIPLLSIIVSYYFFNKVRRINLLFLSTELYLFVFVFSISIFSASVFYFSNFNYSERLITSNTAPLYNLLSVCYVSIAFSFFYFLFNNKVYCNNFSIYFGLNKNFIIKRNKILIYLILILVCLLVIFYVFSKLDKIPIISVFNGTFSNEVRYNAKFGYDGPVIIKNLIFKLVVFLSLVFYGYSLNSKNVLSTFLFYLFFVISFFVVTFNAAKAPLVIYFFSLFFVKQNILNQKKYFGVILFYFFCFILIFTFFFILNNNTDLTFKSGILSRIFVIPTLGNLLTFQLFPSHYDFIIGQNIGPLSSFTGYTERSSLLIMEHINPEGVITKSTGVVSSLFSAEAYAHFGFLGLFISPIFVAFIFSSLQTLVIKMKSLYIKTPESIAFLSYITFYLPFMGGFNDFIWNISLFFILFIYFIITKCTVNK